jgi:hypothetical protein
VDNVLGDGAARLILGDGAARLLPIVTETMREVKEKVGLA